MDIQRLGQNVHPATRIVAWLMLALALPALPWHLLVVMMFLTLLVAGRSYPGRLALLLRRSRLLLLSMLLLYAWLTPGQALGVDAPFSWFTWEGGVQGGLQAGRLTTMLASLAVLLGGLDRAALMQGVMLLLAPLEFIGIDCRKTGGRLLLTLEFVDQLLLTGKNDFRIELQRSLEPACAGQAAHAPIRWEQQGMSHGDRILLLVLLGLLIWVHLES